MRRTPIRGLLLVLAILPLFLAPAVVSAQIPAPETYAGDFWTRPRLTGDWGGFRDQMAKRGVALDVDWLQTLQGVISGGKEQDAGYWGTFEYTLSLDSQKMGLWPGAFLTAYGMSSYGSTVLKGSGALIPVNLAGILPALAEDEPASALMQLHLRPVPRALGGCHGGQDLHA